MRDVYVYVYTSGVSVFPEAEKRNMRSSAGEKG